MTPIRKGTATRLGLRLPNVDRFNAVIDHWFEVFTATVGTSTAEAVRAEVEASKELEALRADQETAFIRRVDRAAQLLVPVFVRARRTL